MGDLGMHWIAVSCVVALAAKITWEWSTGDPVFARGGDFITVPQAHLAGALAGWIATWITGANGSVRSTQKLSEIFP